VSRRLYITHQQSIARSALSLGSPGAARAALRALRPDDFAEEDVAEELLATLRDSRAPVDDSDRAVARLIGMEPAGGYLTPLPTLIGSRKRGTRPE
jgi:hypothetical protein